MALGFLLVAAVVTACVPLVSSVIYVPYIMEDACDGLPRTIQLPPTGPGSAIIMRSHQGAHYKSGLTCNFIVKTSNDYRIAVVFETLQFPGNSGNCSDSLLLSNVEDLSGPICTSAVKEVISKGNVMNVTWSTGGGAPATGNDGFEAVVTAYKPGNKFCSFSEFRCANQRCVADNFACDGHNNCGDNSDEKCSFARSVFRDWGYLILLGVGIVAINLCLIVPMVVRRVGSNSSDLQQQQQSRPNTPAPSELADEDKPSTSTTSDKCTTSSQPATTTTDSQSQGERKAARCKPTASSPASSRGSSKSPSGPASRQKQTAKVNGNKLTKKTPRPHPRSGRHQRCRQRRHRSSSRQPLICPKTLGEPLSCSTYRCIRLPPGKTVSSEIVQRSPIFHVYGAITGPTPTSGPAANDSLSPKQSTPVETSAFSKPSTSPRSPAPDGARTAAVTPAQRLPFQIVPKRPSTPPSYVLRSRSSLSQDNDVECGIREVSCGLERGPVFTPIQSSAFSTARRRAITPARVHRTPRPERHQSSPRIASSALPNTPPRGASMLPASRAPSQEGIDNKGYTSD